MPVHATLTGQVGTVPGTSRRRARARARSIFADLLLLCGVPALVAAKATVGVAIFIGVAILVFGAVYYSIVTIIVRPSALRPRVRSS